MTDDNRSAVWGRTLGHYFCLVAVLFMRTHYFLTVVVGPMFGWR